MGGVFLMKKRLFLGLLVCLLAFGFVLVSCDDGGEKNVGIVGRWESEMTRKQFAELQGVSEVMLETFGIPAKFPFARLVFAADNTFAMYNYNPKDSKAEPNLSSEGTYVLNGSTVTATGTDGKAQTGTIKGSKLNFNTTTDEGKPVTVTFTKK